MRIHVVIVSLLFNLAACDDKADPAPDAKAKTTATTTATAAEAAGPAELSKKRMDEVKEKVAPFQPWAEAYKTATSMLGKETAVDGDKYYWAVVEGDKCAELEMEKKGDQVGQNGVTEIDKMMKSMFEKCAAHAKK